MELVIGLVVTLFSVLIYTLGMKHGKTVEKNKTNEDYCAYCHECNAFYARFEHDVAVAAAFNHSEKTGHTKVYARKIEDMYPMIGRFKQAE